MGGPPPALLPPPPAAEGQTYCLRWNNHKSNLVEILDALIKVESYVDCTIVVDDQVQFKAHRVVLAANSPYFQSILQNVPMDHCSIIFPGVKAFEMRALLEYMYTGEVNVTQSQIPKIMRIAEELEVKGLFDMADLKEKFNKLGDEHADRADRAAGHPYASSTGPPGAFASAATSSTGSGPAKHAEHADTLHSSSVISTSSHVSPSAAPSSSSSPPYGSYKSPYASLYSKEPAPVSASNAAPTSATSTSTLTSTAAQTPAQPGGERAQWPLSPGMPSAAAAAAMLSSVYESAPDMNPLKRKKLSSISSMLMNRDTPILRNVLAQTNPADSSQPMPLMLPAKGGDKAPADKGASAAGHNNNHSFNGSDYSSDKKYQEEPHSPYTDRSFEDDGFEPKGSGFGGNFGAAGNASGGGGGGGQKPEWKRYKQYTRNDIMSAIQCVRDGMSALQASRKFGVPSRTLYDKVKKLGITTGRPMNRTLKRSPSSVESSAAFPYAHGYGQSEPLLSSMHDARAEAREERDLQPKEHSHPHPHPHQHQHQHQHHMPPTIPHHAAALLDHAFLQQALENRGGDIAGREALHAMALAAAAHAAVNRMSTSPGPNGTARSPSPSFALKYARGEHELMLEREREREREKERRLMDREREHSERERDADDEDDHVEDLSVARKDCLSPEARRVESPFSSPPPPPPTSGDQGVIVPPMGAKAAPASSSSDGDFPLISESAVKREIITDDGRAD